MAGYVLSPIRIRRASTYHAMGYWEKCLEHLHRGALSLALGTGPQHPGHSNKGGGGITYLRNSTLSGIYTDVVPVWGNHYTVIYKLSVNAKSHQVYQVHGITDITTITSTCFASSGLHLQLSRFQDRDRTFQ